MKLKTFIFLLLILPFSAESQDETPEIKFDFFGDSVSLEFDYAGFTDFNAPLTDQAIQSFNQKISATNYQPLIKALISYKDQYKLDDWFYYQLIRKTAQQISPKADNYYRYTLYKWFLLTRSGYDAILSIGADRILFYAQSDENIYNIPFRVREGKQYVCLNYHDYNNIDFEKDRFAEVIISIPGAQKCFSYKVRHLPDFRPGDYKEKDIRFSYNENDYSFKVKLNPQIQTIFANYPAVDYESYFNIPLSKVTYNSLIPLLKKNTRSMSTKNGVDYLMRFTRHAFLFETDIENFGKEKRLSPEQTLLYEHSDCEDRAALFFYLVKEIYNLPMIVLAFPEHVTVAVKFDKPVGKPILYKGLQYSVCEPTPQKHDLRLGQLIPKLAKISYEVAYVYTPGIN